MLNHCDQIRRDFGTGVVLLVDDFMTDFDEERALASTSSHDEFSKSTHSYYTHRRTPQREAKSL